MYLMDELNAAAAEDELTYFAFANKTPSTSETLPRAHGVKPLPDVLSGRYKLERLLGVGGMGAVYRARDLMREQYGDPEPFVAIKTLSEDFAEYPDASALLYSEFALTTRLRHPHIVRLHGFDIDRESERAYITLEMLRGLTLDKLLCDHPQGLGWEALRDIAIPLLEALAFAHSQGVLHGDIKPSNVILAEDGLRLFDFGLGQPVEGVLPGLPRLSRSRFTAWTPRYASLELLDGAPLTPSADVYAVSCVLYELATGQHPYRRLSAKQARAMQIELTPPAQLPKPCWQALRTGLQFAEPDRQVGANGLLGGFRHVKQASTLGRWLGLRQSA